jgi:alpha-L-glutamate ligase-like protein
MNFGQILKVINAGNQILGMNSRNLSYIKPYNHRSAIAIVDDKLKLKELLEKHNIPTPKLLAKISNFQDLDDFDFDTLPKSFVIKPNKGFGGDGIIVLFGKKKKRNPEEENTWITGKQEYISENVIRNHVKNILEGAFSMSGTPGEAIFEQRIQIHPSFKEIAYKGIPDIRIIVFNRVPVMAMLRLPTRDSKGKANLHQGGIGIGIDIARGVTTNAIYRDNLIETLPGTVTVLSGIRIPYWIKTLEIALNTAEVSGVGYNGVDIAIDRTDGPMVLEANARPGLSIQLANLAPLKTRLEKVEGLKIKTNKRGIRVAQDLFGGEIEEEIEELTGRTVIGLIETVSIFDQSGKIHKIEAKIDTGADSSSIDESLVKELFGNKVFEEFHQFSINKNTHKDKIISENRIINKQIKDDQTIETLEKIVYIKSGNGYSVRPYLKVKMKLSEINFISTASVTDRSHMTYKILIGRKDLKHFIIDPLK